MEHIFMIKRDKKSILFSIDNGITSEEFDDICIQIQEWVDSMSTSAFQKFYKTFLFTGNIDITDEVLAHCDKAYSSNFMLMVDTIIRKVLHLSHSDEEINDMVTVLDSW